MNTGEKMDKQQLITEIKEMNQVISTTRQEAINFILKLPKGLPLPLVFAETDNSIGVQWHFSTGTSKESSIRTVILSILGDGTISYFAKSCSEHCNNFNTKDTDKLNTLFSIIETI
jgi:hypothetical protein